MCVLDFETVVDMYSSISDQIAVLVMDRINDNDNASCVTCLVGCQSGVLN